LQLIKSGNAAQTGWQRGGYFDSDIRGKCVLSARLLADLPPLFGTPLAAGINNKYGM